MSCVCNNEYDCMCDDTYYLDEDDEPQFDWLDEDDEPQFDWDVFAEKVDASFSKAMSGLNGAIFDAGLGIPKKRYGPIWWELLSPLPKGLTIREENDWEDFDSRTMGSRAPMLLNSTIWLELPNPDEYQWEFRAGCGLMRPEPERWKVWGYHFTVDDPHKPTTRTLTAVLASQPPDFGWWMPSLRSV